MEKPYNLFNKEGKLGGGLKYVVLCFLYYVGLVHIYMYITFFIDIDVLAIVSSENSLQL